MSPLHYTLSKLRVSVTLLEHVLYNHGGSFQFTNWAMHFEPVAISGDLLDDIVGINSGSQGRHSR